MSKEEYKPYFKSDEGLTLRSGNSTKIQFNMQKKANTKYRLFTVGETKEFYMFKDEPDGQYLYRSMYDSLNTEQAIKDRYCIDFSLTENQAYIKRVYKKILWKPILSYLPLLPLSTSYEMGVCVSAKNLKVAENGFLRMRIEKRLIKEGVSRHSVVNPCDETYTIDIPEGDYTEKYLKKSIIIEENTSNVCVFIEGKNYCGQCFIEQPLLKDKKFNLLPPFSECEADREKFVWNGQNMTKAEFPEFIVKINGCEVFNGAIFERIHRRSEWELDIPSDILKNNDNEITYQYNSRYHDTLPYTIFEMGIIEKSVSRPEIVSVQQICGLSDGARVLLRTDKPKQKISVISDNEYVSAKDYYFENSGLHGLIIQCKKSGNDIPVNISDGENTEKIIINRIVNKRDDIITGTGDCVYIMNEKNSLENYICWYLSNGLGNLITVRPAYRWSGVRAYNGALWRQFRQLMEELNIKYALMADGREVPGLDCQPSEKDFEGKNYLGRQQHERDGAQFYWNQKRADSSFTEEQNADLLYFAYRDNPENSSSRYNENFIIYKADEILLYSDRSIKRDYKFAHDFTAERLRKTKCESDKRHTGPSCMFKYLAEAGYSWLGAETMYQSIEPIMGFLRGVAKQRNMKSYGVHQAVQWSTTPHDSQARFKRYRLALFSSYMLGADEINTEDGLWRMEEYYSFYNRFSKACKGHIRQQKDFYDYVCSHSRTGKFLSPFGIVSGRYDGITFFGKNRTWGLSGEQSAAEDSWDIIKSIYPKCVPVNSIFAHNCSDDKPLGYNSDTPYGNADIIPLESDGNILKEYKALAFLGYNYLTDEDERKISDYILSGGKLLMTFAHLSDTTDMADVKNGNLSFHNKYLNLTKGKVNFVKDFYRDKIIYVCDNLVSPDEILEFTDSGRPLVCRFRFGDGELMLFAIKEYPIALEKLYSQYFTAYASIAEEQQVWAKVGDDMEFSVYEQEDGSYFVYFLAIDWYNNADNIRTAQLKIGNNYYSVTTSFGKMIKCVVKNEVGVWAEDEAGEVAVISDGYAIVQGKGKIVFNIAKNGKCEKKMVAFGKNGDEKLIF